jgi:hypothetical protein
VPNVTKPFRGESAVDGWVGFGPGGTTDTTLLPIIIIVLEVLPVEIKGTPDAQVADKGDDWCAEVGVRGNSARSVDLARAREPGRGREANTPEQIPPRGWRDILWRVLWSISADRILSTSGSVAFSRAFRGTALSMNTSFL